MPTREARGFHLESESESIVVLSHLLICLTSIINTRACCQTQSNSKSCGKRHNNTPGKWSSTTRWTCLTGVVRVSVSVSLHWIHIWMMYLCHLARGPSLVPTYIPLLEISLLDSTIRISVTVDKFWCCSPRHHKCVTMTFKLDIFPTTNLGDGVLSMQSACNELSNCESS